MGYSGGADSTCLLHLMTLAGIDCIAAHLNHGMREAAQDEAARCRGFADDLGISFAGGDANVPALAKDLKIGLEEAGRIARYRFFDEVLARTGADLIATAHTADDLVETVILNLVRGTGLAGLSGIPRQRENIVRPLIEFSRSDAREYCESHKLWFHDDPANVDPANSRTVVRHQVIPLLEGLNSATKRHIVDLAKQAGEEDRLLNGLAVAALEQSEHLLNGDLRFLTVDAEVAFDTQKLMTVPRPLLARALRLAVGSLGAEFDRQQANAIVDGVFDGTSGAVTAEGGQVVAEWDDLLLHIRQLPLGASFDLPLPESGEVSCDRFGWRIVSEPADCQDFLRPRASFDVVIDSSSVNGGLSARSYEEGDRIEPLGLSGSKRVSEVFGEMHLTLAARKRLPIVCDSDGPIWVPGGCLAERCKVRPESDRCISLRLESARG